MRFRLLLLSLSLAAARAFAQNVDGLEIRGVVNEAGLNLGVAGAEVTIYSFGADRERTVLYTTATDGRGAFLVHPPRFGDYYVEVKKLGYVNMYSWNLSKPVPETSGILVTLSRERPSAEARFVLMRPAELTGRLLDENRQPIAGMVVQVSAAGWPPSASLSLLGRMISARTLADGSFTARAIIPGDYLVRISPAAGPKAIFGAQLKDGDFAITDQDFETFYWPGGSDERSATPVRVNPGAPVNLGNIMVRKAPYYRVRVYGGCRPGEKGELLVRDSTGDPLRLSTPASTVFSFSSSAEVSCDDVVVTHLWPGSYQFFLANQRGWALTPVEIGSRNLEVSLAISEPADITGRLLAAEGVTLPALDKIRVAFRPAIDFRVPIGPPSLPDSKGAFSAKNLQGPRHQVIVSGLSSPYYVSAVRVDGIVSPDGSVALSQGSRLELVIDDKPAGLTGTVTEPATVFLAKWPSLEQIGAPAVTDGQGRFQIAGLAPGEYRVLAVSAAPLPDGMQFNSDSLGRFWSAADKVTLERGNARSVSLKIVDPMR